MEATVGVAQSTGRPGLINPAFDSFVHAMHVVATVSAGVTLLGVALAWFFLPARIAAPGRPGDPAPADAQTGDAVPAVQSTKA